MSFGDKIAAMMAKPNQDPVSKDDAPWWMKYAGRILGTVGSILAIFLGGANCIGILIFQLQCFLSGAWQMILGFAVISIEAPCCCMFIEFVQHISDFADKRPFWHRAAAYCLMSIPPIFLCPGISSLLGSGMIFGTGIIYGMMAVGKKASIEDMRSAVASSNTQGGMKSNLVEHAQPIGISKLDSNV